MFKTLKEKVLNTITAHPKLVTLGIGLAITFVVGTAIGMIDHNNIPEALYNKSSYNTKDG
jgi:hypothetical protein